MESFDIPCSECNGTVLECKTCGGNGREPIYRCPNVFLTPRLADAIATCVMAYGEGGRFPAAGGLLDQAHTWYEMFKEYCRYKAEEMKKEIPEE